ncbi:MAG: sugar ABC transporter permease [Treponema sp.]|jgi:ABC-type sugar transport system permease subunit|nr:sugar ABC transporter permease [Treponema sp.]
MKKVKKLSVSEKRQGLFGYLFLLPWLIGFFSFTVWPFVYTIFLSFHEVRLTVEGWSTTFNGIDNYNLAFLRNTEFVPALINFLTMELLYAPVITVIAFIIALLLNQKIKFRVGFRALFFLPVIVMSGPVMYQLMDSGSMTFAGIRDMILYQVVEQFSRPLANALVSLFQNFSMVLWFTGIPIILFISGIQKINDSMLEAAKIDSATTWQILWKIIIPIIRPIAMVSVILTIVQLGTYSINPVLPLVQEAIYNTTSGLGVASAFAWIYTVAALVLMGVAFALLNQKEDAVKEQMLAAKKRKM